MELYIIVYIIMEGDLQKLSELIFKAEVKPEKSVQIVGSFQSERDLFEALLMLFTKGMRILHENDNKTVDLDCLTDSDLLQFVERFKALGVTPKLHKFHTYQIKKFRNETISELIIKDWETIDQSVYDSSSLLTTTILTTYMDITSKVLSDFYFQFVCKSNYYIINYVLI